MQLLISMYEITYSYLYITGKVIYILIPRYKKIYLTWSEAPNVPKILKFDNTVYTIDIICIHIKPWLTFMLSKAFNG